MLSFFVFFFNTTGKKNGLQLLSRSSGSSIRNLIHPGTLGGHRAELPPQQHVPPHSHAVVINDGYGAPRPDTMMIELQQSVQTVHERLDIMHSDFRLNVAGISARLTLLESKGEKLVTL